MLDPIRAKVKWMAVTAAAFVGGLAFASGLDWTTGTQASVLQQTAAPAAREVRPVAELSQAFSAIAETVTPAVVTITTERVQRLPRSHPNIPPELRDMLPFRGPEGGREFPQQAGGSGFLMTGDGYIMTNNHVVEGAEKIDVVLQDRRTFSARLVGRDPTTDIAVIRIEGSGFPTLRLGASDPVRVGEWVLAIGNPLDLGQTVTAGIVSARGRGLGIIRNSGGGQYAIEDFIQTDAAINPGNSGGPLVNLRGEAVGVNTAIYSQTGLSAGYGFAVPIDLARRVADDLIRYGKVRRPVLGVSISDVSPEDAEVFKLPRVAGVVVQDYTAGSPAQKAGVQRGDVITAVNGKVVEQVNELQRVVRGYQPGETVTLDVVRYGERRKLQVELTEAPAEAVAVDRTPARPAESAGKLGLRVAPMSPQMAKDFGYKEAGGVAITDVDAFSLAYNRGLREGMKLLQVDRQPVRDVADFQRRIGAKRAGEVVSLTLGFPDGREQIVNIRMPK